MLIDQPIPNFLGGVSQQPDLARFQNQLEAQVNCVSDIVEGLAKRPPTEHIARIIGGSLAQRPAVFAIDRDKDNRFLALIAGGTVRVFDITDGSEKTVTGAHNAYLETASDPAASLRALSVADYTFLLNREKVTAKKSDTAPTRPYEALVFVRAGNYGKNYTVTVKDGSGTLGLGTCSTPDGSNPSHTGQISTNYIAGAIQSELTPSLAGDGFTVTHIGSLIRLSRATPFTVDVEDGQGRQSLLAFADDVQRFTDLPDSAIMPPEFSGLTMKVAGDPTNEFDDYWVRFNGKTWEETIAPGSHLKFDPATMPHALVHNEDDTFEVIELPWVDRTVGDDDSVSFPSLTDQKIRGLLYVGNRLGFLADENVILSRTGDYFNLFKTTATTALDTDPIDTPVPTTSGENSSVSLLEHAVAFNKQVALFAAGSQYLLHSGGNPLTPTYAVIDPATSFSADPSCRPIPVGAYVYFTFDREGATGFREMFVDGAAKVEEAPEITAHIPTYIPSGIRQLAANTVESLMVAVPATGNTLYSYDYFLGSQNDKQQSAWGRWDFHANDDIVSFHFIGNVGYLVIKRADGFHLERMRFRPGLTDPGLGYFTLLDRRVSPTGVYDPITEKTTFTVPWPVTANMQVVTRKSNTNLHAPGVQIPIAAGAGYTVVVAGNKAAWSVVIGVPYSMSWDPTRPYMVSSSANGTVSNTEALLKVRDYSVDYAGTGYFRATFKPKGRTPYSKVFTGNILGATPTDIPPLNAGKFRIKTPTSNKYWSLTIENDSPFPSRFLAGSWRGLVESKSRRV